MSSTEKFCAGDADGPLRFGIGTGSRFYQNEANQNGGLNGWLDSINQTGSEPRLPGIKVDPRVPSIWVITILVLSYIDMGFPL